MSVSVIPDVTVAGLDVTLPIGVKVTGALDVVSPGAAGIDVVTGTPSFTWAKDLADTYDVTLFDALGDKVWGVVVPSVSGGQNVSVTYAGPALLPGMVYQFRVTAVKSFASISQTEDLRGVFVYAQ